MKEQKNKSGFKFYLKIPAIISVIGTLIIATQACDPEKISDDPKLKLSFSTDTVLFDTIFTTYGSTTSRFMVYNKNDFSLKISKIKLGGGSQSAFRLNIDGEPATFIENYTVLPHDSFYIFVDVTIDPSAANLPFIVKDSIEFVTNGNFQDVKLVAWGQNAHFLHDSMLTGNITWSNDLPYVISNHVGIDRNSTLTIQPGVKIYSDNNSGIFVWGTISATGTIQEPVLFTSVRQDEYFKNVPGQWYGIRFLPGSFENKFKNCAVRNAIIGIEVDSQPVTSNPNLILENVRIENMTAVGLVGYTANILAYNLMINNCCRYSLIGEYGGKYEFYHTTVFHESCNCGNLRDPGVVFANTTYYNKDSSVTIINDLDLKLVNSIIWGKMDDEIVFSQAKQGKMQIAIDHCLLKSTNKNFDINSNIRNTDPKLTEPCKYKLHPDTLSPVINKGIDISLLPAEVANDLEGTPRTSGLPDLGAIERKQ